MHLKMPYAKWRSFCVRLNVLIAGSKRGPCRVMMGSAMQGDVKI